MATLVRNQKNVFEFSKKKYRKNVYHIHEILLT